MIDKLVLCLSIQILEELVHSEEEVGAFLVIEFKKVLDIIQVSCPNLGELFSVSCETHKPSFKVVLLIRDAIRL